MDEQAPRWHVSGVVVHVRPEAAPAVARRIRALEGTEVAACDNGKLVVVVEGPDEHALTDTVNRISLMDDVYGAGVAYHEVAEDEVRGEER